MLRVFYSRYDSFDKIVQDRKQKEMALELKGSCEKCGVPFTPGGAAYICSYECTYCTNCAEQMNSVCPNCGGELVRRPRRQDGSTSNAAAGA